MFPTMQPTDADPSTATFAATTDADVEVAILEVVSGPDEGRRHAFASDRVLLGSAEHADLALTDPTVSRLHAQVTREEGALVLRDLDSKNGTWVAGVRVREIVLEAGVSVRLGGTMIRASVDTRRLTRPRWNGPDRFGELVGQSPKMHELFARAERCASSSSPILIRGESGTGKELLARAIHDNGPRARRPWVVLDCASLGAPIADVELFGHVVGAFTGADRERAGVFERADGGTLLLDAVDALPWELQGKLLRALESSEVKRVGGDHFRTVDVRVIATTSTTLERRINGQGFREDLWQRLAVLDLRVPPLRERGRDVFLLARALADDEGLGEKVRSLIERELEARRGHRWPGNVRELRAFVRRLAALGADLADRSAPSERLATPSVRADLPYHEAKDLYVKAFEAQYAKQLLDECAGNLAEASRRARMHRSSFHELVKRAGVERER